MVNTVRTKNKCELLAITGKDLVGVLKHFPETLREMETRVSIFFNPALARVDSLNLHERNLARF